jgi:hypothetical protein
MVLGMHTFAGVIREAFPINHFLLVAICCVLTVAVAGAKHRGWSDLMPAALLAYGALTVETGILVWVLCVAAYVVGYRGVSRRGVGLATVVLAGYFVLRFGVLAVGTPTFNERATGFGFSVLEPPEVMARFGSNPYPLYAYNVVSSIATVLMGEPRGGVWRFVDQSVHGAWIPWVVINVVACTLTSVLIGLYVFRRRHAWRAWALNDGDRLVMLFLAVLPANAAISFVYLKDVVMSPAGVFFALAGFVAIRDVIMSTSVVPRRRWSMDLAGTVLALVCVCWASRLVGIQFSLYETAAAVRTEWAFEEEWEATPSNHVTITTPAQIALRRQLMYDAVWRVGPHRPIGIPAAEKIFDTIQ